MAASDVYEVEKIIKKKYHPKKGTLYLVKWKNFPHSENTWEPKSNFSQKLIHDYESSGKRKKKRKISTTETITTIDDSTNISTSLNQQSSLPSSSTSSLNDESILGNEKRSKGRPRKNSTEHRQKQLELQMHIERKQREEMLYIPNQPPENQNSASTNVTTPKTGITSTPPTTTINKQQLNVFNPVSSHHRLPVISELTLERKLTKDPIIVTDVTAKDLTVTISECQTQEGFFSVFD